MGPHQDAVPSRIQSGPRMTPGASGGRVTQRCSSTPVQRSTLITSPSGVRDTHSKRGISACRMMAPARTNTPSHQSRRVTAQMIAEIVRYYCDSQKSLSDIIETCRVRIGGASVTKPRNGAVVRRSDAPAVGRSPAFWPSPFWHVSCLNRELARAANDAVRHARHRECPRCPASTSSSLVWPVARASPCGVRTSSSDRSPSSA